MAEDSKRERIIQYWVDKFTAGDTERTARFKTVRRTRPELAEMKNFSGPELPVLAIVAKLPKPVEHKKSRSPGGADFFVSILSIDFIVFAMDNENPDKLVSDLADDLWVTIYSDPTTGSGNDALTAGVSVSPEPMVGQWPPLLAFKMIADFSYYHTTGGI